MVVGRQFDGDRHVSLGHPGVVDPLVVEAQDLLAVDVEVEVALSLDVFGRRGAGSNVVVLREDVDVDTTRRVGEHLDVDLGRTLGGDLDHAVVVITVRPCRRDRRDHHRIIVVIVVITVGHVVIVVIAVFVHVVHVVDAVGHGRRR